MVSLAGFTIFLGRLLEMLENYPETRKDVVDYLKECGLVMVSANEDDQLPSEPSQESGGTLEPEIDVEMTVRLARLEQMPASEREEGLKSWTPEERQLAMDQLGGPEQFMEFLDRGKK